MTSLKDKFEGLTQEISRRPFSQAYNAISSSPYINKAIYYNTKLYKDTNREGKVVYEIYYHGNKIISYTDNSIYLTNTCYFDNISTNRRVNKLLPSSLEVCSSKGQLFVYAELDKTLKINSLGQVNYELSNTSVYSRKVIVSQPLYEGIKFIKSKSNERLHIKETLDWYENYKKVINTKPIFKDIYISLLEEALVRDCGIHLYIETEKHLYRNNVWVTNTNRKLPKLTKDYSVMVNKILDKYDLHTNNPVTITLNIKPEAFSNIEKTKELLNILKSAA